jgi:hypothetical protein
VFNRRIACKRLFFHTHLQVTAVYYVGPTCVDLRYVYLPATERNPSLPLFHM